MKNSAACWASVVCKRWALRLRKRKATAKPPSLAKAVNSNTRQPFFTPKLGAPLRVAVSQGAALVPSAKKQGTLGTAVDVPLGHKDAAFVRSHFDAMEARVADAPRANEIVVAVVVTDSGRPHARVGGLQVHEIVGKDGLR